MTGLLRSVAAVLTTETVNAAEGKLALLRSRDPRALRRFWDERRPIVYQTCARILGVGPNAEEVAEDVMVDFLFHYVHRIDHEETVDAYLRLMAARRAIRFRDRLGTVGNRALEAQVDDRTRSPEESAGLSKVIDRLDGCFRQLTPKAQQVVRLRFAGDLTQEQIGAIVRGSKQYIGRVLTQSLDKLRACLEAQGVELGDGGEVTR